MKLEISPDCSKCPANQLMFEKLQALEDRAEAEGTLVAPGYLACSGLRKRTILGIPFERCAIKDYKPAEVSDPALAEDLSRLRPDRHVRQERSEPS